MSKYGEFPDGMSPEGQWLRVSLEVQVENYPVDWEGIDSRTLARQLGYLIGLSTAGSSLSNNAEETLNARPAKILARNLVVEEIDFIDDSMIAKFLDEN